MGLNNINTKPEPLSFRDGRAYRGEVCLGKLRPTIIAAYPDVKRHLEAALPPSCQGFTQVSGTLLAERTIDGNLNLYVCIPD
jgi:hypothetical protein